MFWPARPTRLALQDVRDRRQRGERRRHHDVDVAGRAPAGRHSARASACASVLRHLPVSGDDMVVAGERPRSRCRHSESAACDAADPESAPLRAGAVPGDDRSSHATSSRQATPGRGCRSGTRATRLRRSRRGRCDRPGPSGVTAATLSAAAHDATRLGSRRWPSPSPAFLARTAPSRRRPWARSRGRASRCRASSGVGARRALGRCRAPSSRRAISATGSVRCSGVLLERRRHHVVHRQAQILPPAFRSARARAGPCPPPTRLLPVGQSLRAEERVGHPAADQQRVHARAAGSR